MRFHWVSFGFRRPLVFWAAEKTRGSMIDGLRGCFPVLDCTYESSAAHSSEGGIGFGRRLGVRVGYPEFGRIEKNHCRPDKP